MFEHISTRELQRRADNIVEGHKAAFANGLKPQEIKQLRANHPWEYQDVLLVYLGLKPAAGFIDPVLKVYVTDQNDYLPFLPGQLDDTQRLLSCTKRAHLWNTGLTTQIISSQTPLLERLINEKGSIDPFFRDPSLPAFAEFLHKLGTMHTRSSMTIEGFLYGYPKTAVLAAFDNYRRLGNSIINARTRAIRTKIPTTLPQSFNLASFYENRGFRNEVIRIASNFSWPEDPELLNFLRATRIARVPGFPYFTVGDMTNQEEKQLRFLYESSQIEPKLDKLLKVKSLPKTLPHHHPA